MTQTRTRVLVLVSALVAAIVVAVRAEAPRVYAITGARVVTAAGAAIEHGTVVVRRGVIEAVGAGIAVPPGAEVIDAAGMSVYPGLIDMGNSAGLAVPTFEAPRDARTLIEIERARRRFLLRPQIEAAMMLKADDPAIRRLAAAGITSVLATPPGEAIRGRSSLIATSLPDEEPQIGNVADERRGRYVLRTSVALHIDLPDREGGNTYPASLLGSVAMVRQALIDAAHYQLEVARYERTKAADTRPVYDPALEALQPALAGTLPVAWQAGRSVEIRRVLALSREFALDPIIVGGLEADAVAAELKAQKARVLLSLDFPTRPKSLAPDADEPIRDLRARAHAPAVAAALDKAAVPFAFTSGGLKDPKDFVRQAAKAVKAGLPPDAALRALTAGAAAIAGVGDRLGTIEKGKIANLLVTEGDLFDEKMAIRYVFVDGRPVPLDR
jgi:imidazolonepropionase-like amidohydrolase